MARVPIKRARCPVQGKIRFSTYRQAQTFIKTRFKGNPEHAFLVYPCVSCESYHFTGHDPLGGPAADPVIVLRSSSATSRDPDPEPGS
jgi:hypothetical protein